VEPLDADANLIVSGLLADLAYVQTSVQRRWGYKRAAQAIRRLDDPLEHLLRPD